MFEARVEYDFFFQLLMLVLYADTNMYSPAIPCRGFRSNGSPATCVRPKSVNTKLCQLQLSLRPAMTYKFRMIDVQTISFIRLLLGDAFISICCWFVVVCTCKICEAFCQWNMTFDPLRVPYCCSSIVCLRWTNDDLPTWNVLNVQVARRAMHANIHWALNCVSTCVAVAAFDRPSTL